MTSRPGHPSAAQRSLDEQLWQCCGLRFDLERANDLLHQGANPHARTNGALGLPLITAAAKQNALPAIRWLLDQGVSPSAWGSDQTCETAFTFLATWGEGPWTTECLDRCAAIAPIIVGLRGLIHSGGDEASTCNALDRLLARGADINALEGGRHRRTMLEEAVVHRKSYLIAALLARGADPRLGEEPPLQRVQRLRKTLDAQRHPATAEAWAHVAAQMEAFCLHAEVSPSVAPLFTGSGRRPRL